MATKSGSNRQHKTFLGLKLGLPFLLMITIVAAVVGFMIWNSYRLQRQTAIESQRQASIQASIQVSSYVSQFQSQLDDAARGLTYAGADPAQQRNFLIAVRGVHSHFYALAVTDHLGQETARVVGTDPEYLTPLRSQGGTIAVNTALEGSFYLGRVYLDNEFNAPFVEMSAPILDANAQVTGTLVAEVDLGNLWDIVSKIQVGRSGEVYQRGKSGYAYIVDGEGRLIAYRENEWVVGSQEKLIKPLQPYLTWVVQSYLKKRAGYLEDTQRVLESSVDDKDQLLGETPALICSLREPQELGERCTINVLSYYRSIPGTDWAVIVEQPTSEVYADVDTLQYLALGLGAIILVIVMGLAWFIQRNVLRPIGLLGEGASALASGQFSRRLRISTGDEIEALADEFNAMAESLQRSQSQLEAFALEKSQQAETAQSRVREMTMLVESGRAITSLDLENVLDSLASESARVTKADQCLIYLRDKRTGDLVARGVWGMGEVEYAAPLKWGESAAGWVASEGRELFLPSVQSDRRFAPKTPTDLLLGSLLALPLVSDGQAIGVLQVATRTGKVKLAAEEKRLIEPFARQAAVAYKNSQLYEEERRRAREMTIIAEITRTISASLDPDKTLDLILQSVRELVPYDAGEVNLWDPRAKLLYTRGRGGSRVEQVSAGVYGLDEGYTGWIARNRQPLLITDVQARTEVLPKIDLQQFPVRAYVGVPLLIGNELVGTLELSSYQADAFNDRHVETLQTIASQAAVTIQNARLYEETRRGAEEMAALREAAVEITSHLESERILIAIVQRATALLKGQSGALYRVDVDRQTLTVVVGYNMPRDVTGSTIRFGEGLAGRVAHKRQPMIVNDYRNWEGRASRYADDPFTAVIGVPLIWQDELIGVLDVLADVEQRKFDEDDTRLITLFAGQAAVALQNATLYEQLIRRMEEMSALHETAVDIASQLDSDQLLETIVRRAVDLLHAKGGSLHRYNLADQTARLIISYNMGRDYRGLVVKKGEGLAGQVLQTGQPLIVNDYKNWSGRSAQFDQANFTAAMGAPLIWQDRMLGMLVVVDEAERRVFNLNDLRLLTLFASQAVVALQNADLFAEAQRRLVELDTLADIGRLFSSTLDMDELMETIYRQLQRVMDAPNFYIALYDHDKKETSFVFELDAGKRVPPNKRQGVYGLSEHVIATRNPLLVRGDRETLLQGLNIEYVGPTSRIWMGAPMIAGQQVIGMMAVQHYQDASVYDDHHLSLLESIANQAAIALENARLFAETGRRVTELDTLADIGRALSATLEVHGLLEVIAEQTARVMYAGNLYIALYYPKTDEIEFALDTRSDMPRTGRRRKLMHGMTEQVIQIRAPLFMRGDVSKQMAELGIEMFGTPAAAWIGVPLLIGERVLGVLSVQHYTDSDAYDQGHVSLLQSIANQAAIALENARLFSETQRRLAELATLTDIGQALSSTLQVDQLLQLIYEQTRRVMYAEKMFVALYDAARHEVEFPFSRIPDEIPPGSRRAADVGVTGYIIRNRKSVLMRSDAALVAEQMGIKDSGPPSSSWLGVPMLIGERMLGVIAVQHYTDPDMYDESHRVLLETIASQAAFALENARLYQVTDVRLQQRVDELTGLAKISQEINATFDDKRIFELVLDEAVRATRAQYGTIHLLDVGTGDLVVGAALGYEPEAAETIAGARARYGVGIIGRVVETGKPALVNDVSQDPHYLRVLPDSQSELCVPISYAGSVVGAINLESAEAGHFTSEQLEYLQALASQAAIAIGNAQRYEEQKQAAVLLRRRAEQLGTLFEISQAFRSDRPLEEILDEVAYAIQEAVGFDIVMISVVEGDPPTQRRVAAAGVPIAAFEQLKTVRQPWRFIEDLLRDEFRISQSYYVPVERREARAALDVYDSSGSDARALREPGRWHPHDMLFIPLRGAQERILGMMSVDAPRDGAVPSRATIETLEVFANQAAVAIENAQLYADLRQRVNELMLFNEVSRSISGKLEMESLLATLVEAAAALLHSKHSTIFLFEEAENVLVPRKAHGFALEQIAHLRFAPGEGVAGWVAAEKRGVVVSDASSDPRFVYDPTAADVRSIVAAPLMVGENVIGAIAADKEEVGGFTETDLVLLSTLGDQAAIALENARLYQETQQRVNELSLLYKTGEAVSATLEIEGTLDVALEGVSEGLDFDFVVISLVDERAGEVRAVRGVGVSEDQLRQARRRLDDTDIMADIIRTGKTEVIEGWDERFDREMFEREGHAALVRVFTPLVAHNHNIGLVEAGYRRERRERVAEHEIRLLRALTDRIAAAIENAQLYKETLDRTRELSALLDASSAIAASLELTDVLTALADHLTQVVGVEGCTLSRWDRDKRGVVTLVDRSAHMAGPDASGTLYRLQDYPLTARVLEVRQPAIVYVDDPQADQREVAFLKQEGSEALLMLPLVARDEVFGLIELSSNAPGHRFSEANIRMAQTLADQAGVAISNAGLYEEIRGFTQQLERRVQERTEDLRQALDQLTVERDRVETLFRITSELQASLDLDRVLNRALTLVNENIHATRAQVLLIDQQTDALICRAAIDPERTIPPGGAQTLLRRNEGLVGWAIRRRKSAIVPDVHKDPYWVREEAGPRAEASSALVVPLMVADDVLGTLLMTHPELAHFNEAHLRLVEAAAAQVATAINNSELYRMIRESAERLGQMLRSQQEEASKSQSILEAVADGVMVADRRGRVILFNAAAERILSLKRDELVGRPTDDLLGLYGAAGGAWANVLRDWSTSARTRTEMPSLEQRLQIEDRHVRVHVAPVMMGDEYLGTVSVFRDVTKEVEVDRAKSDFVSTVSHELRTPMTSIKGYADLLMLGAAGAMSDDQRHFLNIIKSNADRLSELVRDLLNISRIESGRVELDIKPLRLDALIDQVVTSLRGKMEEKGLSLSVDVPPDLPAVNGDNDRVIQILTNLVSNAYQYTQPGGAITVAARVAGDMVQTDVIDTGVGIAPEDQAKVFDRFFRSDDDYVQEFAGTGLGLAIVKQLVQMLHGQIWLQSEVGVGTTFSFTLPIVD